MFQIQGKVVLLIGAARGVGLELIRHLLKQQVKAVAIAEINNEVGRIAVQKLQDEFGQQKIILIQANLLQPKELEDVFIETIKRLDHLDIVINNLGVWDESEIDKFQVMDMVTTMRSTLLAVNTFLPQSKRGTEAVVVNVNATVALGSWFPKAPLASLPGFSSQIQQEINNVKIITLFVGCGGYELVSELNTNQLVQTITKIPELKSIQGLHMAAKALISAIQQGVPEIAPAQQQFLVPEQQQSKLNFVVL